MDQRQLRALSIANNSQIIQDAGKWTVPSQSGPGHYSVGLNGTSRCSCPDFDTRGVKCKHIRAVEIMIERGARNGHETAPTVRPIEKVGQTLQSKLVGLQRRTDQRKGPIPGSAQGSLLWSSRARSCQDREATTPDFGSSFLRRFQGVLHGLGTPLYERSQSSPWQGLHQ